MIPRTNAIGAFRCTCPCLATAILLLVNGPAHAQKVLAPGFESKLLLTVPEVEHPSVVTCDDQGNLFVGEDPMDMRGPTTEEFDRVLLFRWNPDGSHTRTVFAEKLSAVFGLVWLDGWLYVMHAPHYSRFRDTDGDGAADLREELADGFGPPAGVFGFNDHIVTGTRLGLDGCVYVSVGDKGIQKATGKDGSSITLEGGGVVRMRPDGTELEIVSSGTRNHLDVAMDSLDNIFTYDNTDDGLGWWTRFTHHIPTGYYGYPFDYLTRPERHLPRISEHGGGSPCGGACYRQAAWPELYRDTPFFAEWGKAKVQCFHVKPEGATFTAKIDDFMVPDGPEPFRPVDLCFSPDGKHLYVADWNFGGWTNPTVAGRIYRVTYVGNDVRPEPPRTPSDRPFAEQIRALGHPAHSQRLAAQHALAKLGPSVLDPLTALLRDSSSNPLARVHAIWTLNDIADKHASFDPSTPWLASLSDPSELVRRQAARALGYRREKIALPSLLQTLRDPDPAVRMESAIAIGRIGEPAATPQLVDALLEPDAFARFAITQAIRELADWKTSLTHLQTTTAPQVRSNLLLAASGQYHKDAVRLLAACLADSNIAQERVRAAEALAEVAFQSAPYEKGWWGTRPAAQDPPRPKIHPWQGTPLVLEALANAIHDDEPSVRALVLRAFQKLPADDVRPVIRELARTDTDLSVRKEALRTLAAITDTEAVPSLVAIAKDRQTPDELRADVVQALVALGLASPQKELVASSLAELTASKSVSTATSELALAGLASFPSDHTNEAVIASLADQRPEIRAKATEVIALLKPPGFQPRLKQALIDPDPIVQNSALRQLGILAERSALAEMIKLATDPKTRFEAALAIARIPDPLALDVYIDGLADKSQEIRNASQAALTSIRDEVADAILARARRKELSKRARATLHIVYSIPKPVLKWQLVGAWPKSNKKPDLDLTQKPDLGQSVPIGDRTQAWREATTEPSGKLDLKQWVEPKDAAWAVAYTPLQVAAPGRIRFQLGSDDQAELWLDGKRIYEFQGSRGWAVDQSAFHLDLAAGEHILYAIVGNDSGPWDFSLQITQPDPRFDILLADLQGQPDLGEYTQYAMSHDGDPDRGKAIFHDLQGAGCVKCHAVGDATATALAGPDLRGVGQKYDRRELIRSVLEPSNRLLSGYEMTVFVTLDGKTLQGVIKSENEQQIELIDASAKTVRIPVDEIDERSRSELSLMPGGLAEGMSQQDFADLIAYLHSLKEPVATETQNATDP